MKKFFYTTFSILAFSPFCASALTYSFLAPLPGIDASGDLIPYLISILQFLIGVAGLIAVIRLVICGFELLTAPGESQRSHAKECLWKVVLGLLLAISAFILLRSINPNLTEPTLALPATPSVLAGSQSAPTVPGWYYSYKAARTGNTVYSGTSADQTTCQTAQASKEGEGVEIVQTCFRVTAPAQGGNNYCVGGVPTETFSQAIEESTRQGLCGNTSCVGAGTIQINANRCVDTCASGCTNVQSLPGSAVSEIQRIQQACGCTVTITGGTEYHLHASHAENRPIFDLRKLPALDAIVRQGPSSPSFGGYTKYLVSGFFYTNEGDHCHVCQAGSSTGVGCSN